MGIITMIPPANDSNMIESAALDAEGRLLVKFKGSGKTYRSGEPVPEKILEGLLNAPSAGKYYNANIRGKFGMTEMA